MQNGMRTAPRTGAAGVPVPEMMPEHFVTVGEWIQAEAAGLERLAGQSVEVTTSHAETFRQLGAYVEELERRAPTTPEWAPV
jgi:hypothetical protein